MEFTNEAFGLLMLRRMDALHFSEVLLSDLYRQYKWTVVTSHSASGKPALPRKNGRSFILHSKMLLRDLIKRNFTDREKCQLRCKYVFFKIFQLYLLGSSRR